MTSWTAACQASLSFTIYWSLLRFMSNELVMPSNHLILCYPVLLPSVFPSIMIFSNKLTLHIRWPKYWSFSISPSNEEQQKEFLRVGELRRLLFHLIFSFVPLPASKQYGYRSTVMTLVSRQVPKTQGGNPSCAQKSVLQEHFFSPCLPLLHCPVSRWRY